MTAPQRKPGTTFFSRKCYLATPFQLRDGGGADEAKIQIFLHIPKCGGTTLHQLLARGAHHRKRQYRRFGVRDFRPGAFIRPGWTGAWQEVERSIKPNEPAPDQISGHFPFGVHRFLGRDHRYITMLRDSVSREVSSYNYQYQRGVFDGELPLEAFIEQRLVLDNPQVRMLAGIDAMAGDCTEDTYRTAMDNLQREFDLVGIVESGTDFIRALAAWNYWPPILYARAQVTGIKALNGAGPALARSIEDYHSYDVRLYRYAREQWEAWKAKWVTAEPVPADDERVIFTLPGQDRSHQWGTVSARDVGRLMAVVERTGSLPPR